MAAGFSRRVVARTVAARLLAEPQRQSYWVKALAAYLIECKRTKEAGMIASDIAHELHVQGGKLLVRVAAAKELSANIRQALRELLIQQTGAKQIELAEHTDPALLGGLVARTPDAMLDVSVRSKLNQLATLT